MSAKRLVASGVAVSLLAFAVVAVLVRGDPGVPEAMSVAGALVTSPPTRIPQTSSLEAPPVGEIVRLLPARADPAAPGSDSGDFEGTARENEMPIVAHGHVQWAGGTISEGLEVVLRDENGCQLALTRISGSGAFELSWDEPLARGWSVGTLSVTRDIDGHFVRCAPGSVGDLPPHLPTDPPVEVELAVEFERVLDFPLVLDGRVFDRDSGEPIEHAQITAAFAEGVRVLGQCSVRSNEDGGYLLDLEDMPLRTLTVWCRADGWQARRIGPRDVRGARTVGENSRLDIALDRPVPWRGRVTSALDGRPVQGATLTVGNEFEAVTGSEVSDEDGCFELELPHLPIEGAWMHVAAQDYAPAVLRGVEPGTRLNVVLGAPVTLAGVVTARGGRVPVEGASVQVDFDGGNGSKDSDLRDGAHTSAQGTFEIALDSAPGDAARIRIEAEGYVTFEARLTDVAEAAWPGRRVAKVELTAWP